MQKSTIKNIYFSSILTVTIAVALSLLTTSFFIKSCWNNFQKSSIITAFCGNVGQPRTHHWLNPIQLTARSLVPESPKYSLSRGFGADKLVDGFDNTQAYPAQKNIEYIIDLEDTYEISDVELIWGKYGLDEQYISYWELLGQNNLSSKWKLISKGKNPKTKATRIKVNKRISKLDIKAKSKKNWIGIYELRIKGKAISY